MWHLYISFFPVTWRLWCIWFTRTSTTGSFCQKGCTEDMTRSFLVITVESVCWWGNSCTFVSGSFFHVILVSSLSLPFLCFKLPLLKWLSKTNMARHFPFSTELWCYNQIAFSEILLWLACSPQKIPLKVFHLILTDENPCSVVMWAPFHFTPTRLQAVLWYYWLGLRVFWSDQPHTGL